jgi:hypothetical protein
MVGWLVLEALRAFLKNARVARSNPNHPTIALNATI